MDSTLLDKSLKRLDDTVKLLNTLKNPSESDYESLEALYKSYSTLQNENDRFNKAITSLMDESESLDCQELDTVYQNKLNSIKSSNKSNKILERYQKARESDSSGLQEDISITVSQKFVPPIDPFTKQAIKNPMKNRICGHLYEKDVIEAVLERNQKKGGKATLCPYIGCSSQLNLNEITEDINLRNEINDYNKSLK